jgi:hypothetical protein
LLDNVDSQFCFRFFLLHLTKDKKNVAEKKYDYVSDPKIVRSISTARSLGGCNPETASQAAF